jgi:hypothetical protein
MVTAAAAAAGSSATADATAAADSVVIASANAFILATSNMRSFIFTSVLVINLDAEWVIIHAHNAWAPVRRDCPLGQRYTQSTPRALLFRRTI